MPFLPNNVTSILQPINQENIKRRYRRDLLRKLALVRMVCTAARSNTNEADDITWIAFFGCQKKTPCFERKTNYLLFFTFMWLQEYLTIICTKGVAKLSRKYVDAVHIHTLTITKLWCYHSELHTFKTYVQLASKGARNTEVLPYNLYTAKNNFLIIMCTYCSTCHGSPI